MRPFQLIIELATPFIMRHPVTLDALLSAAVFNKTGLMGEATIPHIPLAQESGIFKASSLRLPAMYRHTKAGRVMALRGESDLSVHSFSPNNRGKRYSPVDIMRGPYKHNLSLYPAYAAKEVYFFGVGDPDAVVELIQNHIQGLGKRSNAGAGEILSVQWIDSEDYSWKDENDMPARPLPVELWKEIGGNDDAPVAPLAVRFPYWQTEKVHAVFPTR